MKDTESTSTSTSAGTEMGNIYISSEQIIQEVQKFRCLYDPADPDHKDRDVMRDAWLTVTQAVVGEPWAKLNNAEKYEAAKNVENKWRNVRDLIREALKNSKKSRPGYIYDELNPLSEAENSRSLSEADDNAVGEGAEEQTKISPLPSRTLRPKRNPSVIDYLDDAIYDADELSETSDSCPTIRSPAPKRKKTKPQQIIKTPQEDNNSGREQSSVFVPHRTGVMPEYNSFPAMNYPCPQSTCMPEPENPDRMFLLSLLPRFSSLNRKNKLDFQIKAMQLLRGYEN